MYRLYQTLLLAALSHVTVVLAEGDAATGKQLYESRCIGCHSIDSNRVGPLHRGVVGRRVGSVTDYGYSDALKQSDIIWSPTTLDQWLSNPEALIPGQKMGYALSEATERADVIAYLIAVSR